MRYGPAQVSWLHLRPQRYGGNARAGRPHNCAIVDEVPADLDVVRYWDLAATEKTERNDPDWTVGIKLGRDRSGGYYLLDLVRARANPGDVEQLLRNTAEQDDAGRARDGAGRRDPFDRHGAARPVDGRLSPLGADQYGP